MKKITSFLVVLLVMLVSGQAYAFQWNWAEHETMSFFDMKKLTSRLVAMNEANPVQVNVKTAPQGMFSVAGKQLTRRAAVASVDALVGDYTWNYKTASKLAVDPTTAETTDGSAHVTIAKGTEDNAIVIGGMFPNDITATVNLATGEIQIPRQAAGTHSTYGAYDAVGVFYYAGDDTYDAGWYLNSYVPAMVGEDGVITFSSSMWIERILTTGDYAGYTLTPYWLPGSTMTPSEPLTPVTPPAAVVAAAEEFVMTYKAKATDEETVSASVKVGVDGNDVYIQGLSSYLPEAWVKGTKDGTTVTFPGMQYMGEYSAMTSFFFYGGDAVFTYNAETFTYSATGQIFGVLGETYYDGNYFDPVLTKVVEKAGTPATPSITNLVNGNYGWYFTFDIPLVDTDGNNMVASKLVYKIYTDVNHEVSVLTFTPETHTRLTEPMSEFPYGFTEKYDFYNDQIYLNDLYSTTWHQIGIQTIYSGGGETHESEIGWYKIKEYPVAKDITVEPQTGTDISAAINTALGTEGDWAKNVTVTLAEGGAYTITESIVPSASVTINGNGATIDASALTSPFIQMSKTPGVEKVESGQYVVKTPSKIENVKITGLSKALYADNSTAYAFENFTINNGVFQYATQTNVVLNFASSMAINFNITNSTFYSTAVGEANFIALSGKRPWQITGYEEVDGKLTVDHNTFYNVAKAKQFLNTNTLKGQNRYKYEMNSNIFVDVSNKKIYGNMTNNTNQVTTDGKNTYMFDGEFFSETNYNGDEGLQSDPLFKDAANGDFSVGTTAAQFTSKTGDPRWIKYAVAIADCANGTVATDKATAAEGETVTITATPAESYTLDAITVKAADESSVTVTDNKFTMPAQSVTVSATFRVAPVDITIKAEDITDGNISTAINTALAGKNAKNVTITLAERAAYTITESIVPEASVTINGNGAKIDASALTTPFIQMSSTPSGEKNEKDAYLNDGIVIKDVTITGLPYQLIYGNKQKILFAKIQVENSVIGVNGTAKKTIFDFNGGGNASEILINKSTIYANPSNEQNGGLHSSQSGHGSIQDLGSDKQLFAITNSTIYNVAYGKTVNSQRRNNTAGMEFKVENSIIVNSGKSGQFIVGLNGGGANAVQTYTAANNSFNYDGAETNEAEIAKVQEKIAEFSMTTVAGVVAFKDAANADFTLGFECAQYAAQIGDPRWIVENIGEPIVLTPATGADIYTELSTAMATNPNPASITINLAENGAYTTTGSISASKPITINGNGATIDASALDVPFIQMATMPTINLNEKGAYLVDAIAVKDVTIKGLKYQLIYGNKQKYLIGKLSVENSIIGIDGQYKKTILDFNSGGNASEILIDKSTIYANPSNAQNGGLFSSQSGHGSIQDLGSDKQLFAITNSTIYNVAYGKTVNSQRRNNTAGMEFKVENSIVVNSGKSGQFIVGLNGGSANAVQTYTAANNSFNYDGAETNEAEIAKVQEKIATFEMTTVAGVVAFKDADNGDFTLGDCAQATAKIGDPRWIPIAPLYIIGDMNSWDRTALTEMTFNAETQAYEYEFAPATSTSFAFATKQLTADEAAADPDWTDFNTNYRYAIAEGDALATLNEALALLKVNGTIQVKAVKEGTTYKISVAKDLSTVTIAGEAAPEPEPVVVEKLYIMGTGTSKGWDGTTEVTFNEATQAFEYVATVTEDTYLTFGDAEWTSWPEFNGKHRFAPAEGNTDAVLDQAVQLVLVNDGNVVLKTPGKYLLSVTKDLKLTVTVDATGINTVKANELENAVIYNMQGVRVEKSQAKGGVFIVNGRKVVVK